MLITVGILAWERDRETREAVRSVYAQPYRPIEVLLVDASPGHRISEELMQEFPGLRVVRVHRNLGCPGGRNMIFANARGEVVLTIDDDSTLPPETVGQVVRMMASDVRIGIVACNVVHGSAESAQTSSQEEQDVVHFNGQCAIRRSILGEVGYYPDNFLRQGEEMHLGLRVLSHGYRIVYAPRAVIYHHASPVGRNSKRFFFYATHNELQTVVELAPWPLVPLLVLYKMAVFGWYALWHGSLHYMLGGMCAFLYRLPQAMRQRRPVSARTWLTLLRRRVQRTSLAQNPDQHQGAEQASYRSRTPR